MNRNALLITIAVLAAVVFTLVCGGVLLSYAHGKQSEELRTVRVRLTFVEVRVTILEQHITDLYDRITDLEQQH